MKKLKFEEEKFCECSECGARFSGVSPEWRYKTTQCLPGTKHHQTMFQCSYTCYDHALLRSDEQKKISQTNYSSYVKRNEDMMKAQGKTILFPINAKKKKVNSLEKARRLY